MEFRWKKNLKRKWEFWSENVDLGVFDIADFEFDGLEMIFERNWRKRFSKFRNQISTPKTQNRISGFEVLIFRFLGLILNFYPQNSKSKSNFKFWGADFWILEVDFRFCIPKIKNRNRVSGFEVPISHFPETQFFKMIEIPNFGRVDFCIFMPFQPKIFKF